MHCGALCFASVSVLGTLALCRGSRSSSLRKPWFAAVGGLRFFRRERRDFAPRCSLPWSAAVNAAFHQHSPKDFTEHRIARMLRRSWNARMIGDGSFIAYACADNGAVVQARRTRRGSPAARGLIVRGTAGAVRRGAKSRRAKRTRNGRERGLDGRLDSAASFAFWRELEARIALRARTNGLTFNLRERRRTCASVLAGELWGERSSLPHRCARSSRNRHGAHLSTAGLHMAQ